MSLFKSIRANNENIIENIIVVLIVFWQIVGGAFLIVIGMVAGGGTTLLKLRPELREEYVFKRIMESNLFNEAEKYTAQRYIYYIRNNKQWPPIDWKGYD